VKLLDSIASLASAELVALAGRLTRVFSIASPFAPGLHCIGGEIAIDADPTGASGAARLSVAGNGETLEAALVWVKRPIFFPSLRGRATSRLG
jgi:ribosomal protein S12 methylthiotransferase accessory factor